MTVVSLPPRGEWFGDARDGARALRASWHADTDGAGWVVLSTWRGDTCVATARLTAVEAARLMGVLADGLSAADPAPTDPTPTGTVPTTTVLTTAVPTTGRDPAPGGEATGRTWAPPGGVASA